MQYRYKILAKSWSLRLSQFSGFQLIPAYWSAVIHTENQWNRGVWDRIAYVPQTEGSLESGSANF